MSQASKTRLVIQPSISRINDGLYLGDCDASVSVPILQEHNITSMVSLSGGRDMCWYRARNRMLVPRERHLFIPCLDTSTQNLLDRMPEICDFIDKMLALPPIGKPSLAAVISDPLATVAEVDPSITIPPRVLVHFQMGISRSATVVIAYLIRKTRKSLEEMLGEVKGKRKIKPNPNFVELLMVWGEVEYNVWVDKEGTIPKEPYRLYLERRAVRLTEKGLTGNEPVGPVML
ncbi:protein-tyrosine phosphatase-like protein [Parachaetomium inaequale]|uniref:protein-tyrosine-phosphatase n=1 Tax=Parachaetomium inaequale TaxID=2588326 RepID=A0AAN6PK61_9PEZI|nr:protein-tyrosine phosphatase-like protein [Parachaetomium inaequale]